jgi:acyl-CoA synthetase (AMP-forming)/AMP-acid ligase II
MCRRQTSTGRFLRLLGGVARGDWVGRGQPGELCTRGYSLMLGDWYEHKKTAEAIDAVGWTEKSVGIPGLEAADAIRNA